MTVLRPATVLAATLTLFAVMLAGAALLPAQAAAAAIGNWYPAEQLGGTRPVAVTLGDGTLLVATTRAVDQDHSVAVMHERDAATGLWTSFDFSAADSGTADLAADQNGHAVIVWRFNADTGNGTAQLMAARRAPSGVWSASEELATSATQGVGRDSFGVDINSTGDAVVAWESGAGPGATDIAVRRFNSATGQWIAKNVVSRPLGDSDDAGVTCVDGWVQPAPGEPGSIYDGNNTSSRPAAAIDEDGRISVAYALQCLFTSTNPGNTVTRTIVDVVRQGPDLQWTSPANASAIGAGGAPELLAQGTTTFLAWGWWSTQTDPNTSGVTVLSASAGAFGNAIPVGVETTTDQPEAIRLAASGTELSVLWMRSDAPSKVQVASIVAGNVTNLETLSDGAPANYSSSAELAYDVDGGLAVTYGLRTQGAQSVVRMPVHVRTAAGAWSAVEPVAYAEALHVAIGFAGPGKPIALGSFNANGLFAHAAANSQPPTLSPHADFTNQYIDLDEEVALEAVSEDPDGGDVDVSWDLDGNGSYEATGESVVFSSDQAGPHVVNVRALDADGDRAYATMTVDVLPPNLAPIAAIRQGNDPEYAVGAQFQLFGDDSDDADGFSLSYAWTMPNGCSVDGNLTTMNVWIICTTGGSKVFSLVVTDGRGLASAPATATLAVPLPATLTISMTTAPPVHVGDVVSFAHVASGVDDPDAVIWAVDGFDESFGTPASWTFDAPGTYLVAARIRSATTGLFTDSNELEIVVTAGTNAPPTATFTAPSTAATLASVQLNASGHDINVGDTLTYRWDFDGDNVWDRVTAQATTFTSYTAPGTYTIRLQVEDQHGATSAVVAHAITVTAAASTAGNDAEAAAQRAAEAAARVAAAAEAVRLAAEKARIAAEEAAQQELARVGTAKASAHAQLAAALGTKLAATKIVAVPGFDFGGAATAFQPLANTSKVQFSGAPAPLMAVGGCALASVVNAIYLVDLDADPGTTKGRAAARRVQIKLKGQKLVLPAGKVGLLKITMTKAQAARVAKSKLPKLIVTVVLTTADGTKVTERVTYKLKIAIKKPVKK
ncbi:MAG: hypothetical protein JWN72_2851 [Thermoleophilia bacterium]|nr:hypothetical protein [Thermoleophilia bacterium]